ncbi:MAG: carboxylating nicotinate-nucleotide diphosphorylase [Bacteroidales bacterium]|nr:carboxylating nicotinate-nucleotide diphosphorylase [Bacteroidales bacterium]MBR4536299.1 carboxylating nicotinate-nucleotide diphosphorylase [Bacteroidales bacterium]
MTVHETIIAALAEDIGNGDHSSLACIDPTIQGQMRLLAKADGIVAGIDVAREVLHCVDPSITMEQFKNDGDEIHKGDVVFIIRGSSQKMLTAERTLLNFMQRMSGIATTARTYADVVKGTKTRILDTRKTTPNMRVFEKYAVQLGGCTNHRFGLFDMVMLKDNHIDFAGGIEKAIDTTRKYLKDNNLDLKIEIETRNLEEVKRVIDHGGVDRIMLDNFTPALVKEAVSLIQGRYETEASGNITLDNLREYAEAGVDFISVGALTHHIASLDLSLKVF